VTVARRSPALAYDTERSWVALMAPAIELAKAVAATDFVPRAMRNNPAAIAACVLYGDEVGLGPMQSLAKISVIEGRPFIAAEAQRALVYAAGHDMWLETSTNTTCTWAGRRNGTDQITKLSWTMDDARRAKLDRKPNWVNYPRAMLSARASADLVRAIFADAVGGLAALEEHDDAAPTDVDGAGGSGEARPHRGEKRRRDNISPTPAAAPLPPVAAAPTPAAELPLLPGEDNPEPEDVGPPETGTEPIRSGQRNRIMRLFRDRGIADRGERLQIMSAVIGHTIGSGNELSTAEADKVIDYLESVPASEDGEIIPLLLEAAEGNDSNEPADEEVPPE